VREGEGRISERIRGESKERWSRRKSKEKRRRESRGESEERRKRERAITFVHVIRRSKEEKSGSLIQ
jgi:hypothetical protein